MRVVGRNRFIAPPDYGIDLTSGIAERRNKAIAPYAKRPWQCLYFLPEPQGQASLRPTLPQLAGLPASRSAAGTAVIPCCASVSAPARASAISSSPVAGSSLWASI